MFPLFLLLFGLGGFTKIAVVAFAAWLVIVFSGAYGVMNARAAATLNGGTSRFRATSRVLSPFALTRGPSHR